MASPEDQEHARRLLKKYKARLRQRELQVAELGVMADPLIVNEIEDLKASIAELENHKPQSEIIVEARQVARNQYESDMDFLMADGAARNRRQTRIEERQDGMSTELHELKKTVLSLIEDFRQNKPLADWGRQRNFWLFMIAIGLLIVIAVRVLS